MMTGPEKNERLAKITEWLDAHGMTWRYVGVMAVEAADITNKGVVGWTTFDFNTPIADVKAWLGY